MSKRKNAVFMTFITLSLAYVISPSLFSAPPPVVGGITVFATPIDNAASTVSAAYTPSAGRVTVRPGDGSLFGSPTPQAPVRVTIIARSSLDSASRVTDRNKQATFRATGRSGDVLTGLQLEAGIDQAFSVGDYVACLKTAGTDADQNYAINVAETNILALTALTALKAPLASPALTGAPTAPTPLLTDSSTRLATTAFVKGQTFGSGPVTASSYVIDVTKLGVPNDGSADASAGINAIHDALTGPATIYLPGGNYRLANRIRIWKDNVGIAGDGPGRTVLRCAGGADAGISIGIPLSSTDGVSITSANRPDLFGVMDTSLAPQANAAFGFASLGRQILYGAATQFSLGVWSDAKGWDYFETANAFTARVAFAPRSGSMPTGVPLFGLGDYVNSRPSPYFAFLPADHPGFFGVAFRLAGDTAGTQRVVRFDLGGLTGLKRVQFTFNFTTGLFVARVNGALATPVYDNPAHATWGGAKFEKQFRDAPFLWGSTGFAPVFPVNAATDINLYGLWTGVTSVTADPLTDAARYLAEDATTLSYFDVRIKTAGRTVATGEGDRMPAGGGRTSSRLMILDGNVSQTPQSTGNSVSSLTVLDGSPGVLVHRSFTVSLDRLILTGGRQGFATTRYENTYPLTFNNCELGGSDASVSEFGTIGSKSNTLLRDGGNTVVRQTSCNTSWRDAVVTGQGRNAVCIFAFLDGQDGGRNLLEGVMIDNESATGYSLAAFYVENCVSNTSSTIMRHCSVIPVPGLYPLRFVGTAGYNPGYVDISAFVCGVADPSTIPGIAYFDGPANQFVGTIDTRAGNFFGTAGTGVGGVTIAH